MKPSSSVRPARKKRRKASFPWGKLLLFAAILTLLAGGAVFGVYSIRAGRFDIQDVGQIPQRSFVYDVNGRLYSRLYGQNRIIVSIDQVSPRFIDALIAREDSRFYQHGGVDSRGIARAVFRNLTSGSMKEGGSTITQQLARNSFELGGRTLDRKILEAFVAWRIEHHFTKRQILEHYINRIYYGSGYYGLEIASQAYFGKPCKNLTLGEAALMAGLIRSPNNFSPLKSITLARRERDSVLNRMVDLGKIKPATAALARAEPIQVVKARSSAVQENYAMAAVDDELRNLLSQDQIDVGGNKIYTTIDPVLQKTALEALDQHLTSIENRPGYTHPKKAQFAANATSTDYLQGAVVVIDNRSGGVRALVGGRDFSQSNYDRALVARRQTGSAIKPFIYAAAYASGLLPGARVSDAALQEGEVREASDWRPGNSDGTYRGIMAAQDGLIFSRNTMTVRIGEYATLGKVRQLTARAGIADMPDFPSSFLGSFEETPRDLTAAYTVFANQGKRRQNYLIERIDDKSDQPIYRAAHIETAAVDPGVAWLVTDGLRQVLTRGTGSSAKSLGFTQIAAGKTGTTNDYKDAWFVGYTKSLTCGVWVGLDNPQPISAGGYGSALALPVWTQVMKSAPPKQYPTGDFTPGVELRKTLICSLSNKLANTACQSAGTAYSIDLPVSLLPSGDCTVHRGDQLINALPGQNAPSLPARVFDSLRNLFHRGK